MRCRTRNRLLSRDTRGSVLVEAAFALPLMIVILMAVVTYSFWMLAAQSLQQVANDAARAALGGLTATERQMLASHSVEDSLLQAASLKPQLVTTTVRESGGYFTVSLTYDGKDDPFFGTAIIPLPSTSISRSASIEIPDL